jgi:hypothetical protein
MRRLEDDRYYRHGKYCSASPIAAAAPYCDRRHHVGVDFEIQIVGRQNRSKRTTIRLSRAGRCFKISFFWGVELGRLVRVYDSTVVVYYDSSC